MLTALLLIGNKFGKGILRKVKGKAIPVQALRVEAPKFHDNGHMNIPGTYFC